MGGLIKAQTFKAMFEAKLEFPVKWGSHGKSLPWVGGGGGVLIFSETTYSYPHITK